MASYVYALNLVYTYYSADTDCYHGMLYFQKLLNYIRTASSTVKQYSLNGTSKHIQSVLTMHIKLFYMSFATIAITQPYM